MPGALGVASRMGRCSFLDVPARWPQSPRSLRKCVSADRDLFLWCLQVHFDDFVHQLIDISDLIQSSREQSALQFQVYSGRTVDTDQSCMDGHSCVLAPGAGVTNRTPKVDAIPRDKCPISIEDEGFQ